MIRRKGEYKTEIREKMRDGQGKVIIEKFWEPEVDLKANNRLFAKLTLAPGDSIGFHRHENEEEIFVILKGEAEVDDNGKIVRLQTGDTILTGGGAGHAIKSVGKENLEVLAVITCYPK